MSALRSGCEGVGQRVTFLLGDNTKGDFKLKPVFIYQSENPSTLKSHKKGILTSHSLGIQIKDGWVTVSLFQNLFRLYFCPEVAKIIFKAQLLLLDIALGHPDSPGGLE